MPYQPLTVIMFLQIYLIIILYILITNILILVSLFCLILSKHHIQLHRTTLVQHILPEHNHIQHFTQLHSTTTARTQCIPGNEYIHHLNCHQPTIDPVFPLAGIFPCKRKYRSLQGKMQGDKIHKEMEGKNDVT